MADFQERLDELRAEGVGLLAASVDDENDARAMQKKVQAEYPLGYGLDYLSISQATGAFYEPEKRYLHVAGFLLNPDGSILNACYSTGAIGRLRAEDVLALVRYHKKHPRE